IGGLRQTQAPAKSHRVIPRQPRRVVLQLVMIFSVHYMSCAVAPGRKESGNRELGGRAHRSLVEMNPLILKSSFIHDLCAQHLGIAELEAVLGAVSVITHRWQIDDGRTNLTDAIVLIV